MRVTAAITRSGAYQVALMVKGWDLFGKMKKSHPLMKRLFEKLGEGG